MKQSPVLPVLFLTHYDRIGAPSRYRAYQYFPALERSGIAPTVQLIQSEAMFLMKERRQGRLRFAFLVLLAYLRRMAFLLFRGRRYSVWFVEKELFPFLPYWLESLFLPHGVKVVVDYDDAVFLKYDDRPGPVGWLLHRKIARLMRRADVVLSGNEFITDYARGAGAREVVWVPSVVDEERYDASPPVSSDPPVIGWMGGYRNSRHLLSIGGALRRLAEQERFVLRVVGGARVPLPDEIPVEYREWCEDREIDELRQFTLGIMPLVEGRWEKGKCGLKLIQYLAAGIPVVATPIGINARIVQPGINGRVAQTEEEWLEALRQALADARQGRPSPAACRASVAEHFTLGAQAPTLAVILHRLGAQGPS